MKRVTKHEPKAKRQGKLTKLNHLAYLYLEQVQKAVIEINRLGLEVEELEFYHIKPRIIVKDGQACRKLERIGRAIEYGCGENEGGRYRRMQIMAEGIKVIWTTNRERESKLH